MSTDVHPDLAPRPATPAQLDWLTQEVRSWRAEGLLTDDQAARILQHYTVSRRFSLARLLFALGGVFVGVGLIWLVAANLDQLPPLSRLATVAAIWLAVLVGGEVLAARGHAAALVGSVRLIAALAFGAVMFQAAQSLQVPAYEPRLVGLWGAGALVHAYAVRSRGPLLVGLAAGTGWYVWQVVAESPSVLTAVIALGVATVVAVSVAALHEGRDDLFAGPWRSLGALLGLAVLFTAALPFVDASDFEWTWLLVVGVAVAGLTATAAVLRSAGSLRLEPIGAVAVLGASVGLVLWETGADTDVLTFADWANAGVSVTAYVLLAVGIAALGVLRDSWLLTAQAAAGLVIFTTFQSFAVFAQIVEGAWLFLLLGLVFLATGYLFDRARRELAATLADDLTDDMDGDAR